jgi:hypothetical protein
MFLETLDCYGSAYEPNSQEKSLQQIVCPGLNLEIVYFSRVSLLELWYPDLSPQIVDSGGVSEFEP